MQEQIDALVMQALQDAEQIRQRSAKPVNRLGGDHTELARIDGFQHGVEPRALVSALGAADSGVRMDLDDARA